MLQGIGQRSNKKQMALCDYQILEYTASELQTHGVPFIVALRMHEINTFTVNIFILREWRTKIQAASKDEIGQVQIYLEDLRLQGKGQTELQLLFERLARFNVGPIRAFVSGSCSVQDLDEVIPEFFETTRESSFWQQEFDQII